MRKDLFLPGLALTGGLLGFGLRRWQLSCAYSPDSQLFQQGAPATMVLLGAAAVLLLVLALLCIGIHPFDDFLPAFRCPIPGQLSLMTAAAFLCVGAGMLQLLRGVDQLNLWRMYAPASIPLSLPVVVLLCGGLCLLGGLGLLALGKSTYQGRMSPAAFVLASFPAFAGLVWVLAIHLLHGIDPNLMGYGFLLCAGVLLTLAHYYAVSFCFDRCRPRRFVFCALGGTVLGGIALADVPHPADAMLLAALALSGLAMTWALLRNSFGPDWPRRMPSGAEKNNDHPA